MHDQLHFIAPWLHQVIRDMPSTLSLVCYSYSIPMCLNRLVYAAARIKFFGLQASCCQATKDCNMSRTGLPVRLSVAASLYPNAYAKLMTSCIGILRHGQPLKFHVVHHSTPTLMVAVCYVRWVWVAVGVNCLAIVIFNGVIVFCNQFLPRKPSSLFCSLHASLVLSRPVLNAGGLPVHDAFALV